jgi:hypothetical protein
MFVISQTIIDLFAVVTCDKRNCKDGGKYIAPTLMIDFHDKKYMHKISEKCMNCPDLDEIWELNLRALATLDP